ncbi:MAG: hypothetical protein EON91_02705 [Brevundimonas sp.]|uniref:hypothetical protein n=1 Tax=Brevundimonas sp. TaxID=1871086 RepID=UPI00120730E2|nr:hypothetical protein [Brevundimonas sp.]RZJ19124.1 MAG: hypothetical protein EON91_02705 [Brevundimonas sp.]
MANPVRGETPFSVDGQDYTLLLDFNVLCDLEDDLPGLMDGRAELKKPSAIRRVFHAGLAQHHPSIDERGAGLLIHQLGLDEAGELVAKAFSAAFPQATGGKEAARPRQQPRKSGAGSAR